MLKYINLSYKLSPETPSPESLPGITVVGVNTIGKNNSNVYKISFSSHSGTHMDAPLHMLPNGPGICDFNLEELIFTKPNVIDINLRESELIKKKHIEKHYDEILGCDLLLIKTGWGKYRNINRNKYINVNPGFSAQSAEYIIKEFSLLRGIGVDFISLAAAQHIEEGIQAHKILFKAQGKRFLLLEDMNLDYDLQRLSKVMVVPWYIEGVDSAPCTIVGELC